MEIKIWGTRGSRPVAGSRFNRYGGETSCIELRSNSGERIILDAGTGINSMEGANGEGKETTILLSHAHLDHIQGLPFYSGLYSGKTIIYGPKGIRAQIARLFDGAFHPVPFDKLDGVEIREIEAGAHFPVGGFLIETAPTNHPGETLAYKITTDNSVFVYGSDHEIPVAPDPEGERLTSELAGFMSGADIVLVDSHFSERDHKQGWGHSHAEQWAEVLKKSKYWQDYVRPFQSLLRR